MTAIKIRATTDAHVGGKSTLEFDVKDIQLNLKGKSFKNELDFQVAELVLRMIKNNAHSSTHPLDLIKAPTVVVGSKSDFLRMHKLSVSAKEDKTNLFSTMKVLSL